MRMNELFRFLDTAICTPGVVSVVGSGGKGKTTLATVLARKATFHHAAMLADGYQPFALGSLNSGNEQVSSVFGLRMVCSFLEVFLNPVVISALGPRPIVAKGEKVTVSDAIDDALSMLRSTTIDVIEPAVSSSLLLSEWEKDLGVMIAWAKADNTSDVSKLASVRWMRLINFIVLEPKLAAPLLQLANVIGTAVNHLAGYCSMLRTESAPTTISLTCSIVDYASNLWELRVGPDTPPVAVIAEPVTMVLALASISVVHVSVVSSAIAPTIGNTLTGGLTEDIAYMIQVVNDHVANAGGVVIMESRDDFSVKASDMDQKREMLTRLGSSSKIAAMIVERGQVTLRVRRYSGMTEVVNDETKHVEPEWTRDFMYSLSDVDDFVADLSSETANSQPEPRTVYDNALLNAFKYYKGAFEND